MTLRSRPFRFLSLAAILILPIALPAFAYVYPLSSTDIRDAYFLGRRNDSFTQEFLAKYAQNYDQPESGPNVQQIAIDTPFTQVIAHTAGTLNYDAPTAVQDFQGKPLPFRVHVYIYLTPTYTIAQTSRGNSLYPEYTEFWKDFKVKLVQDKLIKWKSFDGGFIYSNSNDGSTPLPIGAHIDVSYDPEKIDAATTEIKVECPDGRIVTANFDLAALR
jgi:hypothetical protein